MSKIVGEQDVYKVEVMVKLPEAEAHQVAKMAQNALEASGIDKKDWFVSLTYYGTFPLTERRESGTKRQ